MTPTTELLMTQVKALRDERARQYDSDLQTLLSNVLAYLEAAWEREVNPPDHHHAEEN